MSSQDRLNRLQTNLRFFDLESFFHDETFFDILEDRKMLEESKEGLTFAEREKLFYIDNIINSYYNLYKDENLDGYAAMSFKLLEKVEDISKKSIESYTKAA
ncbi:MAG: hypothetical protein M0P91_05690 [Sulfuricurvum sp.]|jgi:hypothetical protein|uniref:hypothetical protein n=1 Tax=Sulfuricurvum sp. TaxID=2025608 RepID=UPI0025D28129|nr:hypothetical protein [Sulfuricurvum sp.]MCK9372670.1 hypothetical protein [Sulfuricurvum sp.]